MERERITPQMSRVIEAYCPDGDLSAFLGNLYNGQQKSSRQIGSELGVSPDTVRNWMEQFGLPRRELGDATIGERNRQKALERLHSVFGDNPKEVLDCLTNQEHMTDRQIAQRTNYSNSTIYDWKRRLGVSNIREKRGGSR